MLYEAYKVHQRNLTLLEVANYSRATRVGGIAIQQGIIQARASMCNRPLITPSTNTLILKQLKGVFQLIPSMWSIARRLKECEECPPYQYNCNSIMVNCFYRTQILLILLVHCKNTIMKPSYFQNHSLHLQQILILSVTNQ